MSRFTTIVSVLSVRAGELVSAVGSDATNVSAVCIEEAPAEDDAVQRRTAWSEAKRRRNVNTLIDFDPLVPLVDAWVQRLQGATHALDAGAGLVEADGLAEYILVGDDIEGDVVHWYHGLMRGFAAQRVVTVEPHPTSVLDALAHLKPAPAFPPVEAIVSAALDYVPTELSADPSAVPHLFVDR